jgi:heptaprenyl diphosphate synthase
MVKFMTKLEDFRIRRSKAYESLFSAGALCAAGIIIMPALLFNPNTILRVLQFFFFWFLSWLSGRENKPLVTSAVILGILLFNLPAAYGEVLFSVGSFKVSSGALEAGIRRAASIEGLVMLSSACIRRDIKIPGGLGELLGESFRIFAALMESGSRITRKNLLGDIDALMVELTKTSFEPSGFKEPEIGNLTGSKTHPAGRVIIVLVVTLSWLPMILMAFFP